MRLLSIGLAVTLSLFAMGCSGDDDSSDTGGPVPADEARVEITFTGGGASFVGDREIAEGAVTVVFSNESDSAARFAILGYETGSDALAEELEVMNEGDVVVTSDAPTDGYFEVEFDGLGEAAPIGSHSWTMDLVAGNTYLLDVGAEDFHVSGMWRPAVIEVVAE